MGKKKKHPPPSSPRNGWDADGWFHFVPEGYIEKPAAAAKGGDKVVEGGVKTNSVSSQGTQDASKQVGKGSPPLELEEVAVHGGIDLSEDEENFPPLPSLVAPPALVVVAAPAQTPVQSESLAQVAGGDRREMEGRRRLNYAPIAQVSGGDRREMDGARRLNDAPAAPVSGGGRCESDGARRLNDAPKPYILSSGAPAAPRPNAWAAGSKKIFMNAGKLDFTPPTKDHVSIKVAEGLSKQSVWGWSLLGQYVGFPPGHFLINAMIKSWGVNARYRVEEGWTIFHFESEHDQDKVLKGGPYFIHGGLMILKHIPDKFAFNRRDIATIPLWVRIFGLAKTFWTPEVLGRIASHIGKPLFMDLITDGRKRGTYARVLVEINFAKPIKREVSLDFDDGDSLVVSFLVENEPKYCKDCCTFGHDDGSCSFKEKKTAGGANSKSSSTALKDLTGSEDKATKKDDVSDTKGKKGKVSSSTPPGDKSEHDYKWLDDTRVLRSRAKEKKDIVSK